MGGRPILDGCNRIHNYLRLSVNQSCNLKCVYCQPMNTIPKQTPNLLNYEQYFDIVSFFVKKLNINKVRLTGGEPTIHPNIINLIEKINGLKTDTPELKLCITTNGILLKRIINDVICAGGLDNVNVSLDTVDEKTYTNMSGGFKALKHVLLGIDKCLENNFPEIKINTVVMRSVNSAQLVDIVSHFKDRNVHLRFIEFMPFLNNNFKRSEFVPSSEVKSMIECHFGPMEKSLTPEKNSAVQSYYTLPGSKLKVGFISTISRPFCGDCNRIRVSATGMLQTCLFGTDTDVGLTKLDSSNYKSVADNIRSQFDKKPAKHFGIENLSAETPGKKSMLVNGG